MHVIKTAALVFGLSIALLVYAQSSRPQFEVASVKRNLNGKDSEFEAAPGGTFIARNRTLWDLIFHAYDLRPYQPPDVPEWVSSEHYDIEAKAEGNPTYKQIMPMLQSLLQDRFNLKVHWVTKEQPVFLILPVKSGMKLKPSTATCLRFDPNAPGRPVAETEKAPPVCRNLVSVGEQRRWIAEKVAMNDVTYVLSSLVGRKVVDMTGFVERFDFTLQFSGEPLKVDGDVPTLITALQEELGLKLESSKAPVEVLMIDSVERPSEN
jgi:uncharacterized protein (TIGR03435 family)